MKVVYAMTGIIHLQKFTIEPRERERDRERDIDRDRQREYYKTPDIMFV